MNNVNHVELLWIAINLIAAGYTLANLVDALQGWRAVREPSVEIADARYDLARRQARELLARANARREAIQFVIIAALLSFAIPAAQRPGETPLNIVVILLMAIAIGLAANSYLDRRTRRLLAELVTE